MADTFELTVSAGPHQGQAYTLSRAGGIIGRSTKSAVALHRDARISRAHARITQTAELVWIEDLGSKNGTFLTFDTSAERRLKPHCPALLPEGIQIRLGRQTVLCVAGGQEPATESPHRLWTQLQTHLHCLYSLLSQISQAEREQVYTHLDLFEARLNAAGDAAARTQVITEELASAAGELTATVGPTVAGATGLPPLPDELPDPEVGDCVASRLDVFFSRIADCPDPEEGNPNHAA